MQKFYPWGKENFGIQIDAKLLNQLKSLARLCDGYYQEIEKRRNGSIDSSILSMDSRDELLSQIDEILEEIRSRQPGMALLFENPLARQSFVAALIAETLDFSYQIREFRTLNGKIEVQGVLQDRAGFKVETSGYSDFDRPLDSPLAMAAFQTAAKIAFVGAVAQLSHLPLHSDIGEVLI
jgi:hypothetical protein